MLNTMEFGFQVVNFGAFFMWSEKNKCLARRSCVCFCWWHKVVVPLKCWEQFPPTDAASYPIRMESSTNLLKNYEVFTVVRLSPGIW